MGGCGENIGKMRVRITAHRKTHPIDRLGAARRGGKTHAQVLHLEQGWGCGAADDRGRCIHRAQEAGRAVARAMAASISDRSQTPPGDSRVAKNRAKCTKRS